MSRLLSRLSEMGFSYSEAQSLRRIEMTLSRWGEHQCNGEIERDEESGKTYAVSRAYTQGAGDYKRWPTPDRETGALNRLAKIMAKHPEIWAYYQTDPRGCSLYIGRKSDLPTATDESIVRHSGASAIATPESRFQWTLSVHYSSRGVAVCV